MCIERVDSIANDDTYILDATTVRYFSDYDRIGKCNDFVDHGSVIVVSYFCNDCIHDDVTNVSRSEVAASSSWSYASEEAESYVSNDEFDVVGPTFQDTTWEEESNDESVFSHEDKGMISCSNSKNDNASQLQINLDMKSFRVICPQSLKIKKWLIKLTLMSLNMKF